VPSLIEQISKRLFFSKDKDKFQFARSKPDTTYEAVDLSREEHRKVFHWWAIFPFANTSVNVEDVLELLNRDSPWIWEDSTDNSNLADSSIEITIDDLTHLYNHTVENWNQRNAEADVALQRDNPAGYTTTEGMNNNSFADAPLKSTWNWIVSAGTRNTVVGWFSNDPAAPFGKLLKSIEEWNTGNSTVPSSYVDIMTDIIRDAKNYKGSPFYTLFYPDNVLKNLIRTSRTLDSVNKSLRGSFYNLDSYTNRVSGYISLILNGIENINTSTETLPGIPAGVIVSARPRSLAYLASDQNGVIAPSNNILEEITIQEGVTQNFSYINNEFPKFIYVERGKNQQRKFETDLKNEDLFGAEVPEKKSVKYKEALNEEQAELWSAISNPTLSKLDIQFSEIAEIYGDNLKVSNLDLFTYSTSNKKIKTELNEIILSNYVRHGIALNKQPDVPETLAIEFNDKAYSTAIEITGMIIQQYAFDRRADYFVIFLKSILGEIDDIDEAKEKAAKIQKDQAEDDVDEAAEEAAKEEAKRIEQIQRFFNQCMLLANMDNLQTYYCDRTTRMHAAKFGIHQNDIYGGRYYNIVSKAPHATISKIKQKNTYYTDLFSKLTPNIQAHLVPYIKIEKVFINAENDTITTEIPFENFPREHNTKDKPLDYLKRSKTPGFINKGGHVALEDLSFSFDGETPATADKYVTCNMSLVFTDFRTLFEDRSTYSRFTINKKVTRKEDTFKYIDLVVNPVMKTKVPLVPGSNKMEHYDPTYYRIKITVGWSLTDNSLLEGAISEDYSIAELNTALENTREVFMMCTMDHDIDIKEDGSVKLGISLRGYGDTIGRSNRFNALISQAKETEIQVMQKDFQKLIDEGKCTVAQRAEFAAAVGNVRSEKADAAFMNILKRLIEMKAIHDARLDEEDKTKSSKTKENFKSKGTFTFRPPIKTSLQNEATDKFDGNVLTAKKGLYQCQYFYFGDLMYALLDCMFYDEGSKNPALGAENIRYILTDFSYKKFLPEEPGEKLSDTSDINMPIAAIPISVQYFKNWFANNIISQEISSMPLNVFVLNFLNDVCGCMLSDLCFSLEEDKSLMFRQAEALGSLDSTKDLNNIAKTAFVRKIQGAFNSAGGIILANEAKLRSKNLFPINLKDKSIPADQIITYQIIYMDTKAKYAHGNVAGETDSQLGILHLQPGANYGIVNNVSWKKTNVQYLREMRTANSQGLGDYAQLSNMYSVSLSLFGNFLFYPGVMIFIDPSYLVGPNPGATLGGGSVLFDVFSPGRETTGVLESPINYCRLMGIGGYHTVTKTSVKISNGKFVTDIEAKFEYSSATDSNTSRDKAINPKKPGNISDEAQDANETDICNNVIQTIQGRASDKGSIEKENDTNEEGGN
tara:strand:+ start:3417 stop:7553 length:4137 start_codon:yes stop_codon:yes gene_type:complete